MFLYEKASKSSMFGLFSQKWDEQDKVNQRLKQQLVLVDNSLQDSFRKVKSDVAHINQWIQYLHTRSDAIHSNVESINTRLDSFLTRDEISYFVDEYYKNMNVVTEALTEVKNEVKTNVDSVKNAMFSMQQNVQNRFIMLENQQRNIFEKLEDLNKLKYQKEEIKSETRDLISKEITNLRSEVVNIPQPTQIIENTPNNQNEVFNQLNSMNKELETLKNSVKKPTLKEKVFKKVTRHSKEYVKSMLVSLIKKYQKISGLSLREIVVEEQGIVSKSSFYRLLAEIEEEEGIHVIQEGKEKHYFWATEYAKSL